MDAQSNKGGVMTTQAEDDYFDSDDYEDRICDYCSGTGGNPWDDGITPCPECDGEGYRWFE